MGNFDDKEGRASKTPRSIFSARKAQHSSEYALQAFHVSEESEEVHIDERWLISYADKMTILCGFFIMLFAISTLDPVKLQQVKESAEKSFGKPTEMTKKTLSMAPDSRAVAGERQKLIELKKENQQLSASRQSEKEMQLKMSQQVQVLVRTIEEREQKIRNLQGQVMELSRVKERSSQTTAKPNELEKQNEELKKEVTRNNGKIAQLKEDLSVAKAQSGQERDFMAFVMSWSTKDHDIDLIVEDPSKKVFDFKRRDYPNHPGLLVLDTRRGPGVEVWQSDKVIPGTYKFTYNFYNSYGNPAPCEVGGTLFTPKGSLSFPKTVLTRNGKNRVSFQVQFDEGGAPHLE